MIDEWFVWNGCFWKCMDITDKMYKLAIVTFFFLLIFVNLNFSGLQQFNNTILNNNMRGIFQFDINLSFVFAWLFLKNIFLQDAFYYKQNLSTMTNLNLKNILQNLHQQRLFIGTYITIAKVEVHFKSTKNHLQCFKGCVSILNEQNCCKHFQCWRRCFVQLDTTWTRTNLYSCAPS